MKNLLIGCLVICVAAACSDSSSSGGQVSADEAPLLSVEAPAPLDVPAPVDVGSDTDWEAKVHNKEIEVLQVINVINPIAAYITEGFNQYGDRFSDVLQEEWQDTQHQLTSAMTLYESCKERKSAGQFEKQLFLDMEEVWQLLVKTGVAGVRTNSMVEAELRRLMR
jgi:hypothetical protein